jgi:hypothetical protein
MRDTTPRETPTPTPTASVFESPLPLSDMFVWAPLALVVGQLEGEAEDVPVPEAVLLEAVSMLVTLVGSAEQDVFARTALLGIILPRGT